MQNLPHTFFGSYDLDFKAEVIAAEMIEHGLNPDRVLILFSGALKRPFRSDVISVEDEFSEYGHKDYTVLKTSREGFYDMLPEGLFHHASAHKNANSEKEIIKSIQQRRQEEVNARKFFLPFETTVNFLRMQMALYENKIDKRSHYDELINIFLDKWEIFRYLDARQANIFLHLISMLHNLRDDINAIHAILEMVFLLPVSISISPELPLHPEETFISKLGDSMLGMNFTTGNINYDDGSENINIKITCIKDKTLQQFMPDGNSEKILQLLCDYLLPVNMDVIISYELSSPDKITRLSDDENFYSSVLGEDTYL